MSFDISAFVKRSKEVEDWLVKEFSGIRTGQASLALLDSVRVESYGSRMPLQQIASLSVEDARTIRVAPWDQSQSTAIEKALAEADLGLSVVGGSGGVRVIFPELTGERRTQLVKLAKQKYEEARVSLRSARDDVLKEIDQAMKEGNLSEDEKFRTKDSVQKVVDDTNRALEGLFTQKESQITTV